MRRLTLLLFAVLFPIVGYVVGYSSAQQVVERKGVSPKPKIEEVISGYLTDLNGRYKLRVAEVTFEPGGYVGEHNHVGPHIVCVASGEFTSVLNGKTRTYKAGDCFYEPGNMTHAAFNRTSSPVVNLIFEILPVDWKGGSAVPPKSR
jgi:quercetin dioxygenase-like cupin family protein